MSIELSPVELDYWASRFRGPNPAATVDHAHRLAMAWVDKHAGTMLPSIQHGIIRNYFRFVLEPDAGERKLLMGAIDALLELGDCINANART